MAMMMDTPVTETEMEADCRVGGVRLYYRRAGQAGPTVLLIHGFFGGAIIWHHQLPALAEAGYTAVAVDLPGFGKGDKGWGSITRTPRWPTVVPACCRRPGCRRPYTSSGIASAGA